MRKSKISAEEAQAVEIAAAETKENRKMGFNKMHERDAGAHQLRDYTGRSVVIHWHVDVKPQEFAAYIDVPEDKFLLEFKNKHGETERMVFDTDEFRQSLRWA